jgi:hypothetical protein
MRISFLKPPSPLDSIGYKSDQKGIIKRFLREKDNWQEHLKKTSNYIIQFCEKIPPDSRLAILGSGWLLDLPVDYLVKKFKLIYMVDVLHPMQIKHKFRASASLIFIERDLTGYAAQVSGLVRKSSQTDILNSLSNLNRVNVMSGMDYDVILSVNVLTQLDSILCDFITSKKYFKSEQLINFQKKLQQEHLNLLTSKPSCLISDVREIFLDRNNSIAYSTDTLKVDWPLGQHSESWNWNFDSNYSYNHRYKTNLSVKAEMFF